MADSLTLTGYALFVLVDDRQQAFILFPADGGRVISVSWQAHI